MPSPLTRNALRQAPEAEFYVVAEASQNNPNILKLDWSLAPVQETTSSKVTGVNIKISYRSSYPHVIGWVPPTVTLTDWLYFEVDGTNGLVVADATPSETFDSVLQRVFNTTSPAAITNLGPIVLNINDPSTSVNNIDDSILLEVGYVLDYKNTDPLDAPLTPVVVNVTPTTPVTQFTINATSSQPTV